MGVVGGQAREEEEEEVQLGRQKETSKRWDLFGAVFDNLDTHGPGSTRAVVTVLSQSALLLFQGEVKLPEKKSKQLPRTRYWLS